MVSTFVFDSHFRNHLILCLPEPAIISLLFQGLSIPMVPGSISSETVSMLNPVPFRAYRGESPLGIGKRLPTVYSLALVDAVPSGPHCGIKYSGGLYSLIFYIESACSLTPACSFSLVPSAKTTQAFPHCLVWANSIIFLLSP